MLGILVSVADVPTCSALLVPESFGLSESSEPLMHKRHKQSLSTAEKGRALLG